jgi:uncharacterized damage-inducible protein DinB
MSVEAVLADEVLGYARTRLRDSFSQIERCVGLLTVEQIWHRPNDVSNAVGNLVLHLAGNVMQWLVSGLGGVPFGRDRPAEFARREPLPKESMLDELRRALDQATDVLDRLDAPQLARKVTIQGYEITGLAAVFHVVEHFSLHTGQIVYATKLLTETDLSLYDPQGKRIDHRTADVP